MDTMYFKDFFSSIPFVSDGKPQIVDAEHKPISEITGLGKINILIGANDSGKSYILRQLVKNPQIPQYLSSEKRENFEKEIGKILNEMYQIFNTITRIERQPTSSYNIEISVGNNGGEPLEILSMIERLIIKINDNQFHIKNRIENWLNNFYKLKDVYKLITEHKTSAKFFLRWKYTDARGYTQPNNNEISEKNINEIEKLIVRALSLCKKAIWEEGYYYIYYYHLRSLHRQYLQRRTNGLLHDCFDSNRFTIAYNKPDDVHANKLYRIHKQDKENPINDFLDKHFKGLSLEVGQDIYDILVDLCYGTNNSYRLERFEKFLSTQFFQGKQVRIRPQRKSKDKNDETEIEFQIEGSSARTINQLGTGIQMMIAMTLPLLEREAGIVFIEEPEMYIHPGLQRQLMHIYAQHELFQNFQFFMTTHSNHIIDASNYHKYISLFSVKKQLATLSDNTKEEVILLEQKKRGDMQLLDMLGVGNSANFLANCTIWVEGPTDRYYIRKFFELYQKENSNKEDFKEFKEGLHYAFIEYGGALLANLDFDTSPTDVDKEQAMEDIFRDLKAKHIANKCFLLADRDNKKADGTLEKQASHDKRNELLGGNYYYSPDCNEIENHLSWNVIRKIVRQMLKKSKVDVLAVDDDGQYKDEKLGSYLNKKFDTEKFAKKDKKQNAEDNGEEKQKTIADKKTFCELAVEQMQSYEDLSTDAVALCERMYEFIKRSNENFV